MSNYIELIENVLLERLQANLPELVVEAFPDNPSEYEFIHPVGAVLVQYDSSNFGEDYCLAFTAQKRTMKFNVVSLTRSLRDHNGCYDVLERISQTILGLKLNGFEQFKQETDSFSDETDGVWTYVQSFTVKGLYLQQLPNYSEQDERYN